MKSPLNDRTILAAPSILGLRPSGVEQLAAQFLHAGLARRLGIKHPVESVPTLNDRYSDQRDPQTHCLNPRPLREFSIALGAAVQRCVPGRFPIVLGGDCSILLGIMSGLKRLGTYGIVSLDAHADFYQPEKSTTGEVADMDMAMITGRGPDLLTNIDNLKPYVQDQHAIHIGQRDWEETQHYGSQDIRATAITCMDLATLRQHGVALQSALLANHLQSLRIDGCWLHYDMDVLADDINPAVDYRLPGGLRYDEVELLIRSLFATDKIAGISVAIFNPDLDPDGRMTANMVEHVGRIFDAPVTL
ncbi:arginase family protein [Dawidia soli]|uniref:Arginase family protein n=1 Tax=Dawidia soli TaxID=2782352 RepID=A0AAP2GFZ8_9BACT|nr:arginase family protein [Dawidia soli]MBT1689989.1 arginase family protein [Dawidia soli]